MSAYRVEPGGIEEPSCKFPGCDTSFTYSTCQKNAFDVFCEQYLDYGKADFTGKRHPILDCLDNKDDAYDELVDNITGVKEPEHWCPACNWEGKHTITYVTIT